MKEKLVKPKVKRICTQRYVNKLKAELTKKADTNHSLVEQMAEQNEQLEQAKEIIRELMKNEYTECISYELMQKAKQFLKEIEK